MYTLAFSDHIRSLKSALFLGAHCDDIEIGCGGTILHLLEAHPDMEMIWIVFSSNDARAKEAEASFEKFVGSLQEKTIEINAFQNGFFPYIGSSIKDYFEELKGRVQPDVIFSHYGEDLHQDHRLIAELTWNTFRDHWILEYEVPKYDGGLQSPNIFVPISADQAQRKSELLESCYKTQKKRPWFTASTFEGLSRLRGVECNSESGYAEAFYSRKTLLL